MKILIITLGILFSQIAYAQVDSCSCAANFDYLVNKTEQNYIAYHQKIKGNVKEEKKYENFKNTLQKQALSTDIKNCIEVLETYMEYYKDGHLFVLERPKYSAQELKEFRVGVQEYKLTEPEAIAYFDKKQTRLDPIEGIWYAENNTYRIAIVRNPDNKRQFLAVVLSSTNAEWKSGYVKAVFTKTDKDYETKYLIGNFSPVRYTTAVHKNSSLNIGASIFWGKSYPVNVREQTYLNKRNALLPTMNRIDADNLILTIPSFLVEFRYLDSLVRANKEAIISTKNLIIDIRGNVGGNAIYFPLLLLYYTQPFQDAQGLALSSPDNIAYFEKLASFGRKVPGDTSLNLNARVVRDMKANPGKIVKGPLYPPNSSPKIYDFPKQVCILTNKACASAAESFILHSKGYSNRVVAFGEHTHGIIDYTSTTSVSLLCSSQNYYLGYPTSTLHADIPANGYNTMGIKPDVIISNKEKDKIQFILNWLKSK